jgi:hypothetical protein
VNLEVGKKYRIEGSDKPCEVVALDRNGTYWAKSEGLIYLHYQLVIISEWHDKPDPGEGWRLLHPDEDIQSGDEIFLPDAHPFDDWNCVEAGNNRQTPGMFYRRRIAPQYVPYAWEDRDELRGRWFRRKVKDTYEYERLAWRFDLVDGYFYVDSTRSDDLLDEWVWLDGSPCGKKVV